MTKGESAAGAGSEGPAPAAPVSAPVSGLPPHAWWVGEWQVACDLNRMTRDGEVVTLEPKAMALLTYLASRPGEVVSRDELLSAIWPGVIVGDNALTQAVAKLRKALGDTAREPTYIEAIAKKGYRLIAPLRADDGRVADVAPAAPPPPLAARPMRRVGVRAALLVAAAGLIVAAWLVVNGVTRAPGTRHPSTVAGAPDAARTRLEAPDAPGSAGTAAPIGAIPTVVVQPFRGVGDDTSQAALARALGADLVTDLSKVAGIRVVTAEASASAPGGSGPRYRLGGTVQQEEQRLRLNVLLTDDVSGQAVWSTRLERQASDLFAAQDALVNSILQVLPVKLSEAETRRLAQRQTRSIVAWQTFVRAQAALLVRQRTTNEEARALYREAIGHDPAFARAYSGLAMTYALEYQLGWARDPAAALARAAELAQTSAQMNPEAPEARWVLAFVHAQRREHEKALRELDDALRLNPSYADAYALKGGIETYVGRPAAAVPLLRQALRLHPDSGWLYFLLLGRAYYFLGDDEQARVNLDEALMRNAQSVEARLYLAASSARAGDVAAARWQADEIRALNPGFRATAWLATYPLVDAAQRERLLSALKGLGLD